MTMTFARRAGRPGPPVLRTSEHPTGIPGLSPQLQAKVDEGNHFAYLTAIGSEIAHMSGCYTVIANPWRSYLWLFPRLVAAIERCGFIVILLDYCQFGERWQKRTKLCGDLPRLSELSRCCQPRGARRICSASGLPHTILEGKNEDGEFKTKAAQRYPQALCLHAVDLVAAAAADVPASPSAGRRR